jgi:hypothetical protein
MDARTAYRFTCVVVCPRCNLVLPMAVAMQHNCRIRGAAAMHLEPKDVNGMISIALRTGSLPHIPSIDSTAWQCWHTLLGVIRVYIAIIISFRVVNLQSKSTAYREVVFECQWCKEAPYHVGIHCIYKGRAELIDMLHLDFE